MNTGLFRPASVAEALALLARLPDAKIISGGASLVAMINARLADPAVLVSLARIEELKEITEAHADPGLDYPPADRKSTRLNSSHSDRSRMPSSA